MILLLFGPRRPMALFRHLSRRLRHPATLHTMYGIPPYPIQCMTTLHPLIQCKTASLIQCMSHPTHFIQCMRLSPIQCMANLTLWRPDAWTRKIRFPQLVRNGFKTAISDYDFDIFCPEATHGSFCPFLGTFEEAAPEGLGLYLYVCSCMFVFV